MLKSVYGVNPFGLTTYLFERVSDGKRVAVPQDWQLFDNESAFDAAKVARKHVDALFKEDEAVS
ncbi:hypothetical protein [Listeria booriae]|uniref:hypothetical protein n=1 Tax=Listeria booriae TaxID=1552123 RepID=UPI001627A67F|nr:hypothetical protein [Listeria booriae]